MFDDITYRVRKLLLAGVCGLYEAGLGAADWLTQLGAGATGLELGPLGFFLLFLSQAPGFFWLTSFTVLFLSSIICCVRRLYLLCVCGLYGAGLGMGVD